TLPLGEGSRRSRAEVCLLRSQAEEAPVPLDLDRAHRRRRPPERTELQPVHQRTEESRRGTGPQDPGGFGGERSSRIRQSGGAGEEGARVRAALSSQLSG